MFILKFYFLSLLFSRMVEDKPGWESWRQQKIDLNIKKKYFSKGKYSET